MARNRKRSNQRRAGQPVAARPGLSAGGPESNGAPDPLAHAAPDAELAEAQLAVGRSGSGDEVQTPEDERELEELATGGAAARGGEGRTGAVRAGRRGGELAVPSGSVPAERVHPGARLVGFLQGSWAELQRVQWPDRRQVLQATGVVIGFVIVAGLFLGVADFVAGKIMTFILK